MTWIKNYALKIILEDKYKDYQQALNKIGLETLADRRQKLCNIFAKKGVTNPKIKKHFRLNSKTYEMNTRNTNAYEGDFAATEGMKKSPTRDGRRLRS